MSGIDDLRATVARRGELLARAERFVVAAGHDHECASLLWALEVVSGARYAGDQPPCDCGFDELRAAIVAELADGEDGRGS